MSKVVLLSVLCALPVFNSGSGTAGAEHSVPPPAKSIPGPGWDLKLCAAIGSWHVEFTNGVAETCEIRRNGTASVIEPQRSSEGKVMDRDGSFVIAYRDDRIERWTPVGRQMVVEHWFPSAKYPSAGAVLGIGQRLPEKQAGPAAEPKQEDSKKVKDELDLLQGTWSAVALEENGREIPKEELKKRNLVLTFNGNTFRLQVGTGAYQGTFRIDPKANPKTIDFIWKRFGGPHILPEQTLVAQGIYELADGTLKTRHGLKGPAAGPGGKTGIIPVWGVARPKDFKTRGAWETTIFARLPHSTSAR